MKFSFFKNKKQSPKSVEEKTAPISNRNALEQRVKKGTEKAVKEYGYVFRKLAEYDRI